MHSTMFPMLIWVTVVSSSLRTNVQSSNTSPVPVQIWPGVSLVSRSGFFIRVEPDGQVRGTLDCNDDYARLEIQAVGPGLIYIKGIQTGLMLSMTRKRSISARNNTMAAILHPENSDILWREESLHGTCFKTYKSSIEMYDNDQQYINSTERYSNYLAINRSGSVVSKSKFISKSHFLKIHY